MEPPEGTSSAPLGSIRGTPLIPVFTRWTLLKEKRFEIRPVLLHFAYVILNKNVKKWKVESVDHADKYWSLNLIQLEKNQKSSGKPKSINP